MQPNTRAFRVGQAVRILGLPAWRGDSVMPFGSKAWIHCDSEPMGPDSYCVAQDDERVLSFYRERDLADFDAPFLAPPPSEPRAVHYLTFDEGEG